MSEPRNQSKLVTWDSPGATSDLARRMSGLDFLTAMMDGRIPHPPIARLMDFSLTHVVPGEVEFRGTPDESLSNPIGSVHGGYVATLLDSALACATHSSLEVGVGYTSIEIKVNYLRAVSAGQGPLAACGRVTKRGRRIAFAEGEIRDSSDRLVATAQSSCLIIEPEGRESRESTS